MFGLNSEQWFGLIRQVLPVVGGIFVSLGWIKPSTLQTWTDTLMQVSGPALIVISAVWSAVVKTKAGIVASAAALPEVQSIKLEPTTAGRALEQTTPANVSVSPIPASSLASKPL